MAAASSARPPCDEGEIGGLDDAVLDLLQLASLARVARGAAPITSAGRFSPLGPLGVGCAFYQCPD